MSGSVPEGAGPAELSIDGTAGSSASAADHAEALCDALEHVDASGWYPAIEVHRPWSQHNPVITGEFARPGAIRSYLRRELAALIARGATVAVRRSRPALDFDDPAFFAALDEFLQFICCYGFHVLFPPAKCISLSYLKRVYSPSASVK